MARADVAEVAAAVLRDPGGHQGETYTLAGPEAISFPEAAMRVTATLGRSFPFVEQTVEEAYASRRVYTDAQWQLDAWVSTYLAVAAGGLDVVGDDVPRLTGHAARTLQDALSGS